MEKSKENFNYRESASSPMDNYYWIENAVFDYLPQVNSFSTQQEVDIRATYKTMFEKALSHVMHLISNDLDKGNVYFTLIAVSIYESFIKIGLTQHEAVLLTDRCVNEPVRPFIIEGTRKAFDRAEDPFRVLVENSKERERNYFGSSFVFERPIDNDYGYVLHVKKCLFHEVLKLLHRQELQPVLCRMDLGWINAIEPSRHHMLFARPVTFASGSICQMWFIRKEPDLVRD